MPVSNKIYGEIKGDVAARKNLEQIASDLHGVPMVQGIQRAALMVQRDAKLLSPVNTGQLKSSITAEVRTAGNEVTGAVGTNVKHGPYMEMGTKPHWPPLQALETWAKRHHTSAYLVALGIARHGTKPRKYLQGAFEKNKLQIQELIGEVVKGIVNRP